MFKNKGMKTTKKPYGEAQGCQSFSSYSGCQNGYYQEQGY
jgi:hypothetical protein